ncbi:DNA-binding protein [Blautia marasmi]|uniref:DNA-binding protein n=1 Tax=Blautia marasmi TaxID=1917868 RepID=UPI000CF28876|nr:DNA-binding protein [Blautia marasmi]
MIEGYTTIKVIAEKWGITPRRVQVLCSEGKISGAVKFGRDWAIPIDAKKPEDKRITTGKYKNWRNKDTNS